VSVLFFFLPLCLPFSFSIWCSVSFGFWLNLSSPLSLVALFSLFLSLISISFLLSCFTLFLFLCQNVLLSISHHSFSPLLLFSFFFLSPLSTSLIFKALINQNYQIFMNYWIMSQKVLRIRQKHLNVWIYFFRFFPFNLSLSLIKANLA
jgi:hypothetical protein